MHQNDLARIEKFIINHRADLQQNKLVPVYEDIFNTTHSSADCARFTVLLYEKGIDAYDYVGETLPPGIYAESWVKVSPKLCSGKVLNFSNSRIKYIGEEAFGGQHFEIADLSGVEVLPEYLFVDCYPLRKIILDCKSVKSCPRTLGALVYNCPQLEEIELKDIKTHRPCEALEEFCWNTDNFYGGALNKKGYVKLTWEGKDDEF